MIEHLTQTPIEDFRKLVINIILAPYLINIRKLLYQESYTIIRDWLDKCDKVERLDNQRNFEYRIKYELKNAMNKGIGPMSKEKNKDRLKLPWIISIITIGECSIMISSSIHTIFNKKIIDYVEEGESVSQKDIAIVEVELIAELEELISIYF